MKLSQLWSTTYDNCDRYNDYCTCMVQNFDEANIDKFLVANSSKFYHSDFSSSKLSNIKASQNFAPFII